MENFKWILSEELINNLVIHTTIASIRRAIDASVYKKRVDDQFVHWELQDELNSPILTHVYIVDYLKYLSLGLNRYYGDYNPTEPPSVDPTEVPTELPIPTGYLTWNANKTGSNPKKELNCHIENNMAIFDGNIAYYNQFYDGPGNYVGVTYHFEGDPDNYPCAKLITYKSHSSENIINDNPFTYDANGNAIINIYHKVTTPGEEFRSLLLLNGTDGGPDDPYTISIIVAISQESNLLTQ